MRFQPVKCNMMQLTNKHLNKIQAAYTLEGTVLENVDNIKYLGVTITNDLKWNTHISNICTKANRTLGFFFFFFFFVDNGTPSVTEDYLPCAIMLFTMKFG